MASSNQFSNSGAVLVEILVAIALMAVITPSVIGGLITARQGEPQQSQRLGAVAVSKQTQEAFRVIREKGWSNISTSGTYHPVLNGGTWELATGVETVGSFNRSIIISDVFRDSLGNISTTGTIDPSTKKVRTIINWTEPYASSMVTDAYFTRYLENIAHVETTYDNFSIGNTAGATVNHTNNDLVDGDITLGGGGHGDWCKPNLAVYGFNLSHNANARAISAIEGRAYAVTGDNNSSETFFDISITDTNPPVASASGSTTGQKKAYGVFGDNLYGYIATDTRQEQGTIINLSNHTEIGFLDLGQNSLRGRSITVVNDLAYLSASDNKIYIFNIATKTGTHASIAASAALSGTAKKISIVGNNLYASVDSTSNQLVIIPLTNNGQSFGTPVNISVSGQVGRDVFIKDDGNRAYLATSVSASQNELFIIDTNPLSPNYKNTLASYDTSGMDPQGVTVVTNNKAVIVGNGGIEYQVVDIANDVISNCSGSLGDFNINIYGIASVIEQSDGDAYSYIITSDSSSEFKIIEGGPSGKVGKSGVYESATFTVGYPTAFNRLSYTASTPVGTTVQFQVAVADAVSGNCNNAVFIYRDIDSSGALPLDDDGVDYENPGQCFRYKILFDSSSAGTTPVVYDVTVNLSP